MPNQRPSATSFVLKASCVMIAAAMLGACAHKSDHGTATAQPLIGQYGASSSHAKSALVSAISEHLKQERYVLSTYQYHATPLATDGSIDAGADSLWTTAIKTQEFKDSKESADVPFAGYRTALEMYELGDDSPYLRYDDEQSGNVPAHAVSIDTGMSEDYQVIYTQISELDDDYNDCQEAAHQEISTLLVDNPTLTASDKSIRTVLSNNKKCTAAVKKDADALLPQAKGYQSDQIRWLNQCSINFQNNLTDVLSASRKNRSLAFGTAAHDDYASVYENFKMCRSVYYLNQRLEPAWYIENQMPQKSLISDVAVRNCRIDSENQQKSLRAIGDTYRNAPEKHTQAYYDHLGCVDQFIKMTYEPNKPLPAQPTDIETAELHRDKQYEIMGHYEFDDTSHQLTWLEAYKQMKSSNQAEQAPSKDMPSLPIPTGMGGLYTNMMSSMLDYMKKTPEQLQAKNLYQYNNTVMTVISHHKPAERKLDTLFAFDFHSATADQSLQLPVSMDFDRQGVTADVSAALPLIALVSPKHAPLPADIPNGLMKFQLPSELQGVLPLPVVYDSLNRAFLLSVSELDTEKFTPMALTHDAYAKQLGANQAIKLSLGTKELGKMFGIISKQLANDLKAYIDAHPELYQADTATESTTNQRQSDTALSSESDQPSQNIDKLDPAKLKQAVDDWVLINQGYHTSDVGSLFALFESILPIGMDTSIYYYLDGHGKLIGLQTVQTMDGQMQNLRLQTIGQTRISAKMPSHSYAKQLTQSFAADTAVDGNAWLAKIREENTLKSLAADARDQYEFSPTVAAQAATDAAAMGESEAETQCSFDDGQVICY